MKKTDMKRGYQRMIPETLKKKSILRHARISFSSSPVFYFPFFSLFFFLCNSHFFVLIFWLSAKKNARQMVESFVGKVYPSF